MTMQTDILAGGSAIGPALWRIRLLIGLVALHFLGIYAACLLLGHPFGSGTAGTLISLLQLQVPLFLVILLFWRFGWMIVKVRPRRPITWFANDLKDTLLDRDRIFTPVPDRASDTELRRPDSRDRDGQSP